MVTLYRTAQTLLACPYRQPRRGEASEKTYRQQCRDISRRPCGRLKKVEQAGRRHCRYTSRRRRHIPSLTNATTTATMSRRDNPTATAQTAPTARSRRPSQQRHTQKPTTVKERDPLRVPTSTSPTEPTPLPTPKTTAMTTRPTRAPTPEKCHPDGGALTVVESTLDRKAPRHRPRDEPDHVQRYRYPPGPPRGWAARECPT